MLSHPDIVLTITRERLRDAEARAHALELARAHHRGRSLLARLGWHRFDSPAAAAWDDAVVNRSVARADSAAPARLATLKPRRRGRRDEAYAQADVR